MTTVEWANVAGITLANATETVVASVAAFGLGVDQPIMLECFVDVGAPDEDTDGAVVLIRRGTVAGTIVGTVGQTNEAGTDHASTPVLCGPYFDGPGLPSGQVYVLTVAMAGATGPSTDVSAALVVTYN